MKVLMKIALVLAACVFFDPALAQPPKAASEGPSVADTIKQLVRDWCDAMIVNDMDKLGRIIADDWTDGWPGKISTKSDFLSYVKSGKHKLEACDFGPMDVKVLGNVAVLQASLTERRVKDGQVGSVRIACMDVFEKRGDRWVVVRSQAHKL
jgi:ketosteroid isomerase-like protein